jgi:hypothetical protein
MLGRESSRAWTAERPANQTHTVATAERPDVLDDCADVMPVGGDGRELLWARRRAGGGQQRGDKLRLRRLQGFSGFAQDFDPASGALYVT